MEIGRNVTLGRYVPGNSRIHRMDPRAKIIAWVMFAVGIFVANSFVGFAVLASFLVAIMLGAHLPILYVMKGLKAMLPFLIILYLFQLAFSTTLYPEGRDVIFDWWIFTTTGTGVRSATLVILRVLLLFVSMSVLTLTTSVVLLMAGAERLGAPFRRIGVPNQELAMAMGIAVRFVPTLTEEAERLMKAQTARGARLDVGNFIRRTKARLPILVPLMVNTLRRSHDLINAMESRCYRGGDARTKRRVLRMSAGDWGSLLVAVLLTTAAIALKMWTDLP